jgi:putative restriction endonuclease
MVQLNETLARLDTQHRRALEWFKERAGTEQPWPQPLSDGTLLATRWKGIYKPAWSKYALSVRQTLGGPYPDREPILRTDGTWSYAYYQEDKSLHKRDKAYTNRALLECQQDGVPVGVMRQTRSTNGAKYEILGLALVNRWKDGYFHLEGFSRAD